MIAVVVGQLMQRKFIETDKGGFWSVSITEAQEVKGGDIEANEFKFAANSGIPGLADIPVNETVKMTLDVGGYLKGYEQKLHLRSVKM